MSLPYPSMTFVPLDVLTAEEMNQLVANIEALANGSGLDSTAYPCCLAYKSTTGTIASGDIVAVNTFKTNVGGASIGPNGGVVVPKTGKYIISAGVGGLFSVSKGWIRITKVGGSTIATVIDRSNASQTYKSLNIGGIPVSLAEGDEIYIRAVDDIQNAGDGGLTESNYIGLTMIP